MIKIIEWIVGIYLFTVIISIPFIRIEVKSGLDEDDTPFSTRFLIIIISLCPFINISVAIDGFKTWIKSLKE